MSKGAVRLNYEKKRDIEQITKIIREFNAEKRRYSTKTDPDDDEELAERLVNSGIGNVDRYLEDFHNEIERNEQFAKDMGFTPEVTPQYIAKEYKRRAEKYKDALNEMADFVADQLVSYSKGLAIRLLTKVLSDSFLEKAIKEEQAVKGNIHKKVTKEDKFARKYYCDKARLNSIREDKKRQKKKFRQYEKDIEVNEE